MDVKIADSWKEKLQPEFEKPYFKELVEFVKEEYQSHTVYPPGSQIFNAFEKSPFDQTRVVIIWKNPYNRPSPAKEQSF